MLLVSCVLFPSHTVKYADSEQCIIYASAACLTYDVPVRKALHVWVVRNKEQLYVVQVTDRWMSLESGELKAYDGDPGWAKYDLSSCNMTLWDTIFFHCYFLRIFGAWLSSLTSVHFVNVMESKQVCDNSKNFLNDVCEAMLHEHFLTWLEWVPAVELVDV